MTIQLPSTLRGMVTHGVQFIDRSENQAIGHCPFCGKQRHFYANVRNALWDCKLCGASGNFQGFLAKVSEHNVAVLDAKRLTALAKDRQLPVASFHGWNVGWSGVFYTIPAFDAGGRCIDLRCFRLGKRSISTPGARTGLLGLPRLLADHSDLPVYVCEGEWDAIALRWLVRKLDKDNEIVVVGVPGANTCKAEWVHFFSGRRVRICYDADGAGEAGEVKMHDLLSGVAEELRFLHWPADLPDGFDIRDYVVAEAIKTKNAKAAWAALNKWLRPETRATAYGPAEAPPLKKKTQLKGHAPEKPSVEGVFRAFRMWLEMPNLDMLTIAAGAVLAHRLPGDPVWLFIVAPPGSAKTEILSALAQVSGCVIGGELTPRALVSGWTMQTGGDPSLLPKLDGKVWIIKDFTPILDMHPNTRDEIFSILRDAYDGRVDKFFGTGLHRTYKSRFGILAGTTPVVERSAMFQRALGERFIKFRAAELSVKSDTFDYSNRIRQAIANLGHEAKMRKVLGEVMAEYCATCSHTAPDVRHPERERLIALAQFCADLRSQVDRDVYTGRIQSVPTLEVGTRVVKQLTGLCKGVALFLGHEQVTDPELRLVQQAAFGSVPDLVLLIVRTLWSTGAVPKREKQWPTTADIAAAINVPVLTIYRILEDLSLLGTAQKGGLKNRLQWGLSKRVVTWIEASKVFDT